MNEKVVLAVGFIFVCAAIIFAAWLIWSANKERTYLISKIRSTKRTVKITVNESEQWPECQEFYDLMQRYRHTPSSNPHGTYEAYEAVKHWLRTGEVK